MAETPRSSLTGKVVLVIEDEPLISWLLEDIIGELGMECAGVATTLPEAKSACVESKFDFAILDAYLRGEDSSPVATMLLARKKPFIFASGYGSPDFDIGNAPVVPKPYDEAQLYIAFRQLTL